VREKFKKEVKKLVSNIAIADMMQDGVKRSATEVIRRNQVTNVK
jgi:hypothetical protein